MEITKISLYKQNGDFIVASGTLEIDNLFFVKIAIGKAKNGSLFIKYPSRKGTDDKWYQDCGFIIREDSDDKFAEKNKYEKLIFDEYNKMLGIANGKATPPANSQDSSKSEEQPKEPKQIINWA